MHILETEKKGGGVEPMRGMAHHHDSKIINTFSMK